MSENHLTFSEALQIAGRVERLDPAQIAHVCSPTHVQNVLQDLQRDVSTLMGMIKACHAEGKLVDRIGDPTARCLFMVLVRCDKQHKRWVQVHADDRAHARALCAQAGLLMYQTQLVDGEAHIHAGR